MRCPSCGKVYPANEKMCNLCKERLVSEAVYSNRLSVARQKVKEANVPKCPICGSTDLKKLSALNRSASAFMWGLGSNKIGKTYECQKCKATF